MANEQNLRPCEHVLTQDEQKAGGIASGRKRRAMKTFRELAESFGKKPVSEMKP